VANVITVLDMVAADSLAVAHEKATFIGTADKQFDASYNASHQNSKNGQTLRVREANKFTRRAGSRVMDVQDQNESTQTITVATQDGVDIRFNSAELAQSVSDYKSSEFKQRYIVPAVSSLVSAIDADMLTQFTKDIYNQVGTAGTVVGSSSGDISAIHAARARLNQGLAPKDDRSVQIDSVTMAAIANGNKGLFTPNQSVDKAFLEGYYGRIAGAEFYENERTWSATYIADVTGTTDAAALVTDGGTAVDMHTTVASPTVGETFTIAGVYACHPETKASLGYLQQFVVMTTSAGAAIAVSPATFLGLSASTAAKQNVCSSTGAKLALTDFDSKTLTFGGAGSAVNRQNVMYHKNAFAFVTAELPLIAGENCSRMTKDGLSLRVWQGADIRNDEVLLRIDILYGGKTLRPEWACRITN
jgi:hypothetical protein